MGVSKQVVPVQANIQKNAEEFYKNSLYCQLFFLCKKKKQPAVARRLKGEKDMIYVNVENVIFSRSPTAINNRS